MPKSKHYSSIFYKGVPNMTCDFCDYKSKSKSAMRLHSLKSHNTKFEFEKRNNVEICMGCKKEFKSCICKRL